LWQDLRGTRMTRHNLRCRVSILQREGRLGRDDRTLHGIGGRLDFEQGWTDHRRISRSSVKPRRTGDCMMNESWFDDPAVITGDVAFARTKWKHMSSLRAAFCCEKIGVRIVCLMLEQGDWPGCASNASIYQQARHPGRSAPSAGAWRAEISCTGPVDFRAAYGSCERQNWCVDEASLIPTCKRSQVTT
jgi:hypothetical protein